MAQRMAPPWSQPLSSRYVDHRAHAPQSERIHNAYAHRSGPTLAHIASIGRDLWAEVRATPPRGIHVVTAWAPRPRCACVRVCVRVCVCVWEWGGVVVVVVVVVVCVCVCAHA